MNVYPWTPDGGHGAYRNPIIAADYSDPDIERHGEDYYLIASSFNCTPGLPILHSRDLMNWKIINHAVKNLPDASYQNVRTGCGVWAPAIRFRDGKFWIFFPMPDEGIFVTTAVDPAGEWSEPHCVLPGRGFIDPCPLWDDDGRAYLIVAFAKSRCGIKHRLSVFPMAPDASAVLGEATIIYENEARHPTLEGPKWLKKDGWYYILAPAGGVKTGWQVVFRSRTVYGPYEDKIVLAQGKTPINGPHQGALIDTPKGEWWFVHFQDDCVYGRIVHLQPVEWVDGWPLMGANRDAHGCGEPVLQHCKPQLPACAGRRIPQTSDDFEGESLGLQWQWEANHRDDWASLRERRHHLRLFALPLVDGDLRRTPHLLGQKFPARAFSVTTHLELAGDEAGLFVMGRAHAALLLRRTAAGSQVVYVVNDKEQVVIPVDQCSVHFRVSVADGALCQFAWRSESASWETVAPEFQAREGHWIGARVGIFCAGSNGHADFEFFCFAAPVAHNDTQPIGSK